MEEILLQNSPHILAIPYPLMGHMIPILQLCKMLIATAGCKVTIACNQRDVPSLRRLLPAQPEDHHMKVLPISDGLPEDLHLVTWDAVRSVLHSYNEGLPCSFAPHIRSFSDVVCVISDVYLSWTQDVADQLGVPRIAVWVAATAEYQVYSHAKALVKAGKLPFKAPLGRENDIDNMISNLGGRAPIFHRTDGICEEEEEEIKLPGLPGLNRRDFPTFLQIEDALDEPFYMFIEHVKTGMQASMLLFNSFQALEGTLLDTLKSQGVPANPIGPLFLLEELIVNEQVNATLNGNAKMNAIQSGGDYPECLKWLDGQKPKSVIYVAFGTLIHLAEAQVQELALGLLSSGQPFIWVYPKPSSNEVEGGIRPELPEGFLEQVKDTGLVLEWAPQKHILSHPSIGGFLSHCGWNSTLESICCGVPILGFPHVSDQSLHCKMIVEEWKVGLRLKRSGDNGVALVVDIARLTRELLVGAKGDELRKRLQELKVAAHRSIQRGGCSRLTLDAIIKLVKG